MYIQISNLNDEFKEIIQNEYPWIRDVVKASFVKPKINTTAVLLTFNLSEVLHSIYIPKELAVHRYEDWPIICHKWYK